MMRILFRWFIIVPLGIISLLLTFGFYDDGELKYAAITFSAYVVLFFIFFKLKRKKPKKVNNTVSLAEAMQDPSRLKPFDRWLIYKAAEATRYEPAEYNIDTSASFDYINKKNAERNRMLAEEESKRRKQAEYEREAERKRKADYYQRQYDQLKRNDPQGRNYQTKDAEYNKNYFRR